MSKKFFGVYDEYPEYLVFEVKSLGQDIKSLKIQKEDFLWSDFLLVALPETVVIAENEEEVIEKCKKGEIKPKEIFDIKKMTKIYYTDLDSLIKNTEKVYYDEGLIFRAVIATKYGYYYKEGEYDDYWKFCPIYEEPDRKEGIIIGNSFDEIDKPVSINKRNKMKNSERLFYTWGIIGMFLGMIDMVVVCINPNNKLFYVLLFLMIVAYSISIYYDRRGK